MLKGKYLTFSCSAVKKPHVCENDDNDVLYELTKSQTAYLSTKAMVVVAHTLSMSSNKEHN